MSPQAQTDTAPAPGNRAATGPGNAGDPICLASHAQERCWLLAQLHGASPAFTLCRPYRLQGNLDVPLLERSLVQLQRRHSILRTTFHAVDGRLYQTVHPHLPAPVTIVDVDAPPSSDPVEAARQLAWKSVPSPFDLTQGPLLRCELYRVHGTYCLLVLLVHGIVADEPSVDQLLRELASIYEAAGQGVPGPLPATPPQYAEFAGWQRACLETGHLGQQLDHLANALHGRLPILELPLDRSRPAIQTLLGARQTRALSAEVTRAIHTLAATEGTTPSTVLLAAYAVLLHRYTAEERLLIGIRVDGRHTPHTQGMVGPLTNLLIFTASLAGEPAFHQLLRTVAETLDDLLPNQDVPFEALVEDVKPERNLSVPPLVQATYSFRDSCPAPLRFAGLTLHPLEPVSILSLVDLHLDVLMDEGHLRVGIEYNQDLFEVATIERMLGHFDTLVRAITTDPTHSSQRLEILPQDERQRVLVEWNQTDREYARQQCLHQLVEDLTVRTPEAIAVEDEGCRLSYRELSSRANALAYRLRSVGVGPEVIVPLCVERSAEMVVGVLGILKAGGAYLPLDPTYPRERLCFMLSDCGARVVVTQTHLTGLFPQPGTTVLCLDQASPATEADPAVPPDSGVAPENLAYVIYTSGSTGRPKGVQVCHRSVVNVLSSIIEKLELTCNDTVLAVTTLSFDIATAELFLPLLCGARVVVVSRDVAGDGPRLLQALESSGATFLQPTPVTWRLLLAAGWRGSPGLKMVSTGEALPGELPALLLPRGCCLWNLYGPTETTIWSTGGPVTCARGPIHIGRPLANTRVYILDAHLQPVPCGVVGELCIGGDGVARGYLNRPELTAERFVPDPFQASPGGRLYRTGDLARFRPDGTIECLGRIDHQVKVRGFRIETGEIEAVLAGHPAVGGSVVTARDGEHGEKRLVAYVRPHQDTSVQELRVFLASRLPEYMVPSTFVFLEALPMTPSGKVDRQALPALQQAQHSSSSAATLPVNPLQAGLAAIWARMLKVHPIDIRANFFELGGDSLMAALLCLEIERQFGRTLPLATLFQAPTIQQLADLLSREAAPAAWSSLVAIQPRGSRPPLCLIHGVGGNVVGYEALARRLGPDQPVYGFQSWGLSGRHRPHTRIEEMAAHYLDELSALQPTGPYQLAGMSFGGLVAYEMAQQLHAQGQPVALLALLDTYYLGKLDFLTLAQAFARRMHLGRQRLELHVRDLKTLRPASLGRYLREKARILVDRSKSRLWQSAYRHPEIVGAGLADFLSNVREANRLALKQYRPQVYPGQITLFRARPPSPESQEWNPWTAWNYLARGGLTVHWVSGDHVTMVTEPHVEELAEKLRDCLTR